ALPRGGVPVGFEVAQALHADLDIFLVRKLGVPGHEELAMGAIASGGSISADADRQCEQCHASERWDSREPAQNMTELIRKVSHRSEKEYVREREKLAFFLEADSPLSVL